MPHEILAVHRRGFLLATAATAVMGGLAGRGGLAHAQDAKPLPDYVKWKEPGALVVHSDQTLETRRAFTGSLITPEDRLYIRNNVKAPEEAFVADRDGWQVEIAGVKTPNITVAFVLRF
jgi:sulfite oxidase